MNLAEGSLEERRHYLIVAHDLGYGDSDRLAALLEEAGPILASDS